MLIDYDPEGESVLKQLDFTAFGGNKQVCIPCFFSAQHF
jgi:hypothetical protein